MLQHTSLPWSVAVHELLPDSEGSASLVTIRNSPGNHCLAIIGNVDAATRSSDEANARFIAAACNSFYELVNVAEQAACAFDYLAAKSKDPADRAEFAQRSARTKDLLRQIAAATDPSLMKGNAIARTSCESAEAAPC